MPVLWGTKYSRAELVRLVGDMSQLAAVTPVEFYEGNARGSRALLVRNSAGLAFTVLADRGMGLLDLHLDGLPLAFLSSVGPANPAFGETQDLEWMRTWPGGLLTSCGLTQVGSPCVDEGEVLGLHGRIALTPAKNVRWDAGWQGEDYVLAVEGALHEIAVMRYHLALKRRIWTTIDSPRIWIEDRVENLGYEKAPLMFLQHFNFGFPLIGPSTRLVLPQHSTEPRDAEAEQGAQQYMEFHEPAAGYQEQVFYHDLDPDQDGMVFARLENSGFGRGRGLQVELRYPKKDFPILVQWKMMREGMYVVGLEPSNCRVGGRCVERAAGRLQYLEPQESRTFSIELAFHAGTE